MKKTLGQELGFDKIATKPSKSKYGLKASQAKNPAFVSAAPAIERMFAREMAARAAMKTVTGPLQPSIEAALKAGLVADQNDAAMARAKKLKADLAKVGGKKLPTMAKVLNSIPDSPS